MMWRRRPSSGARGPGSEDGAVAIEFAIVAPLMLALMFGTMELGRLLWFEATTRYAVEEGARCATLGSAPSYCCALTASYTCGGGNTPADYAASVASGLGLAAANFTLASAACGKQVTSTNVNFQFIVTALPGISLIGNGNGQVPVAVSACYP